MIKGLHPLILIIIITNVLVSIKGFKDIYFFEKYKFNILAIKSNQWIRYLSSGFLHVDYNHLFLNMLSLYFFGDVVLYSIGITNFIFFRTFFFCFPLLRSEAGNATEQTQNRNEKKNGGKPYLGPSMP